MSIALNFSVISELQENIIMTNYVSSDPEPPFDPLAYIDSNGDYFIHTAAQCGDMPAVALLPDAGVGPNQAENIGSTALRYTYAYGNLELINSLLRKSTLITIRSKFEKLAHD